MRRVILAVFGTVAGLVGLLSFKTHSVSTAGPPAAVGTTAPGGAATTTATAGAPSPTPSSSGPPKTSGSAKATTAAAKPSTTTKASTKTVTGTAADTQFGPVQVRIVVTNGKVSNVTAVEYPNENPLDAQINASAIPALNQEALAAGSAKIDMISGATYTSQGYLQSLQSALDKAGL